MSRVAVGAEERGAVWAASNCLLLSLAASAHRIGRDNGLHVLYVGGYVVEGKPQYSLAAQLWYDNVLQYLLYLHYTTLLFLYDQMNQWYHIYRWFHLCYAIYGLQ